MATYANRTCTQCGIKQPQPEMYQIEIKESTGKSKKGVDSFTFVGAALGNKSSKKSLTNWAFNNNQRNYTRKRKVWVCEKCHPDQVDNNKNNPSFFGKTLKWICILFAASCILSIFTGESDPSLKQVNNKNTEVSELVSTSFYKVVGVDANDVLNIRAKPQANSEILGSYNHDEDLVEITGSDGKWLRVNISKRSGWVHSNFLEAVNIPDNQD